MRPEDPLIVFSSEKGLEWIKHGQKLKKECNRDSIDDLYQSVFILNSEIELLCMCDLRMVALVFLTTFHCHFM